MRRVTWFILALVIFAASAYPCWRLELLCRREIYHGLESAGIITRGTNLWGQILGRNIPLHPPWMTAAVRGAGTLGTLPAMLLVLSVYVLMSIPMRLLSPARRWRQLTIGTVIAALVYAIAVASLEPTITNWIRDAAFRVGKSLGCGYAVSGEVFIGRDGPFSSGAWAQACNLLWREGPRFFVATAGFIPALAAFHVVALRRLPTDPSLCHSCGYDLTGVQSPTCPECGEPRASHKHTKKHTQENERSI